MNFSIDKESLPTTTYNSFVTKIKDYNPKGNEFIALDLETTGLSPKFDKILEIAAIKFSDGTKVEIFHTLVNPKITIPKKITEINGITDDMVKDKPTLDKILPTFLDFLGTYPLVGHNIMFDIGFIKNACKKYFNDDNYWIKNELIDTVKLSRKIFENLPNHKLDTVSKYLNINIENRHRATDDALACAQIYLEFLKKKD